MSFLLVGCSSVSQIGEHLANRIAPTTEFKKTQTVASIKDTNNELKELSRQLTTGVVDSLSSIPISERKDAVIYALELAKQDQALEGLPVERINVKAQIEKLKTDRLKVDIDTAFLSIPSIHEVREIRVDLQKRELMLEARLDTIDQIQSRSWWSKVKASFKGWTVLIVIVCIIVCACGGAPIVGFILSRIVSAVPSLLGVVGVVGTKTYKSLIHAYNSVEDELKNKPDDELYTAKDVKKLIDRHIEGHLNHESDARVYLKMKEKSKRVKAKKQG